MFEGISISNLQEFFEKYLIQLFGVLAFGFTFTLGVIGLLQQEYELMKYLPYGIVLFIINIIYLKSMRLAREDYELALKKEKVYSQNLLKFQKLFLRHAVHETNTPLAVIMANIELYELEHGKNDTLSNIEAATKNIYGIYDDLSYLTKQDKIIYTKQPINLALFVKSRLDFFDIVAKQSNIVFNFSVEKTILSIININETKLQRIVDNTLTNALKYTKEFRTIDVEIFEKNRSITLSISSCSSMIKDTDKVFEPYYREDSHKEGLGLGLNLVKTICDDEYIEILLNSNEKCTSFNYVFKGVDNENFIARR
ncbi:MAG: HAMP domain-containing sensor histidine kinase [Campylobacterota bacterium]|nr:HAMP domain-containing sensor histidine kinase [Campylobacterota bacterium]